MAINDIVQTIAEARVDARSLSEFVFKPAGFKVTRRLAPTIDTLQFYVNSLSLAVTEAQGKVEYIETTVQDAINNTAIEGGVLADTFVTVDNTVTQRQINRGLRSVDELLSIVNPSEGMRVQVNSYHEGLGVGGGEFYYDSSRASENDGGSVLNGFVRSKREAITPYSFGVIDKVVSGEQLQKFFDFLGLDNLGYSYDITCDTRTDRLLTLTDTINLPKTVSGYMQLYASGGLKDNESPNLLTLTALRDWMFLGGFYINGYTGFTAVPQITNGITLHNCRRIQINRVEGRGTEGFLIVIDPQTNNNMSTLGKVTADNCGVYPANRSALPYNFISSSGVITTAAYRSLISIDLGSVPTFLLDYTLIVISGEPHVLMGYDSVAKTASIYPGFLGSHEHSNVASLIYGGALLAHGSDSGELSYDLLTATNCGVAHLDKALYGTTGKRLTAQNCGVAYLSGSAPATVGGFGTVIQQPYTEANTFDLISISTAGGGTFISPIALNINKCRCINPPGRKVSNISRFNIIGFYDAAPDKGRWISTPNANNVVWSAIISLSTPTTVYIDGTGSVRTDRVLNLIDLENFQSHEEGWNSREVVLYNIARPFKITCKAGETVNNLPELTVEPSEVKDGTTIKANKIGTNWVVKFYPPYEKPEKSIMYLDNVPSTGYHKKGGITYNNIPSAGGYVGWVCIESGEPGTWLPFGKIG